ncbi:hypothetical protein BDQ17DRAFT_1378705 [Cyathus striatus]|nr:hypothetical protein BDQ17DRAFT_1378705 [Cyathus striatus]
MTRAFLDSYNQALPWVLLLQNLHNTEHDSENHETHSPWFAASIKGQVSITCERFLAILLPEVNKSIFKIIDSANDDVTCSYLHHYRNLSKDKRKSGFLRMLNIVAANTKTTFHYRKPGYAVGLGTRYDENAMNNDPFSDWVRFFVVFGNQEDHEEESDDEEIVDGSKSAFNKSRQLLCANYASDLLSSPLPRRHVIGVYVLEDEVYLLYYDHSVIIRSEPFHWRHGLRTFFNIIHTLSNLDWDRLGFERDIFSFSPFPQPDIIFNINGLELLLIDVIKCRRSIIGRGTLVVRARVISSGVLQNKTVAIKFSYFPQIGWKREADFVLIARKEAGASKGSKIFLKNLPNLFASIEVPPSAIQERIHKELGNVYEPRELRVTVFEELFPVTALTNYLEMLKVFKDILHCDYWLYIQVKLAHRDMSPDNLMVRRIGDIVYGVINDFGIATFLNDIGISETSLQRIGTRPFLACDILRNPDPIHPFRYELESLFYAFYFVITNFEDGRYVLKDPFKRWFYLDPDPYPEALSNSKQSFLFQPPSINPSSNFSRLKDLAEKMKLLICQGYFMQVLNKNLDEEAIGSIISYTKFCAFFEGASKS